MLSAFKAACYLAESSLQLLLQIKLSVTKLNNKGKWLLQQEPLRESSLPNFYDFFLPRFYGKIDNGPIDPQYQDE